MGKFTDNTQAASSRTLVFLPLFVLTIIFGAFAGIVLISTENALTDQFIIVAAGAMIYAIAVGLLSRVGMNNFSKLEELGLTDSLSGLPNRRALHIHIDEQHSVEDDLALALIDLDGFKSVNDHYGHTVGDNLIKEVGQVMVDVCGDDARCYRLGGDEFAIVKMGPLAPTIVEGVCRVLLERLAKPIALGERRIAIGASVGLSRSSKDRPNSSSELLRQSDVAMYASKRAGKMRCMWFVPDFDRSREVKRDMDNELRHALANEELTLNYQPLVDATTRKVTAVECLLRWQKADGTFIGPDIFIPVAEESGLINAIGLWVLRRACADALDWNGIKLSINISAAQLRNPEFPIQLGTILEETGFPPELLELEITETCLVLDPVIAERSLDVIRNFGVNVVLDDFGTGYASIGFLRQFRFHKLKLDRSLVVDSATDEASLAMMLSSISMARALKMGVTAEGVETTDQADMVRAAGCDQIQGWLYFKALPAQDIPQHLETTIPAENLAPVTDKVATP